MAVPLVGGLISLLNMADLLDVVSPVLVNGWFCSIITTGRDVSDSTPASCKSQRHPVVARTLKTLEVCTLDLAASMQMTSLSNACRGQIVRCRPRRRLQSENPCLVKPAHPDTPCFTRNWLYCVAKCDRECHFPPGGEFRVILEGDFNVHFAQQSG